MKIRLTPLSFVISVLLIAIAYLLIFQESTLWSFSSALPLAILVILCFFTDIFFRRYIIDVKRIWIVEIVFIIFAAVMMMVFHLI